jgi:4-hydroxy-3-polyprenylbenzoate decarboxylase
MRHPLVLGITGASGAIYAKRLLEVLAGGGAEVHLTISPSGRLVIEQELGIALDPARINPAPLLASLKNTPAEKRGVVHYHKHNDYLAPVASGSFLTAGMVICPCSGSTMSAVASGSGNNLIQRAADVHLKERRKLILVPRETPLSLVHLENMKRACEMGAVVLPAMPAFYHGVQSVQDLVDFVVARILDQLDFPHALIRRWGAEGEPGRGSDTDTG